MLFDSVWYSNINFIVLSRFLFFCLGDACTPNPCQNGGTCVFDESGGSFRCYCPPGYTGRTCDAGKFSNYLLNVIRHK